MTAADAKLFGRHCIPRALLGVLLLVAIPFPGPLPAGEAAPRLSSDTELATAGFYRLSWKTAAPGPVELQEADNPAFSGARPRYRGPDRASVISGMPDGEWHYRVRALGEPAPGPWSEAVTVTVTHHPLSRALLFFTLGVAVFVATVVLILRGQERTP